MFRVGDEVECVDASRCPELVEGCRYTIIEYYDDGYTEATGTVEPGVCLAEAAHPFYYGYRATRFRKVQKRNDRLTIEDFLTIKPGQFEEPRRTKAPAKKRERA